MSKYKSPNIGLLGGTLLFVGYAYIIFSGYLKPEPLPIIITIIYIIFVFYPRGTDKKEK